MTYRVNCTLSFCYILRWLWWLPLWWQNVRTCMGAMS